MNRRHRLRDLLTRWATLEPVIRVSVSSPAIYACIKEPDGHQLLITDEGWLSLSLIQTLVQEAIRDRGLHLTLEYDGKGYHTLVRTPNNEYCHNTYDRHSAIALLSAYVPLLEAIALIPPAAS
jgi:hypothetical protein